jgi:hypothetical protein
MKRIITMSTCEIERIELFSKLLQKTLKQKEIADGIFHRDIRNEKNVKHYLMVKNMF